MKAQRILKLAIVCCLAFTSVKGQTVNDIKLADLRQEYIEVTPGPYRNSGVYIYLDYGQKWKTEMRIVKDNNGKGLEYDSVIDFINKMKLYDYELFQAYTNIEYDSSSTRYILKRKSN